MLYKAEMKHKQTNLVNNADDVVISEVYIASEPVFRIFCQQPLADYIFIDHFKSRMKSENSVHHCLLVLGENCTGGVLVQCGGHKYARYSAYLPGGKYMFDGIIHGILEDVQEELSNGGNTAVIDYKDIADKYGLLLDEKCNAAQVIAERITSIPGFNWVDAMDDCLMVWVHPSHQIRSDDTSMSMEEPT